LTRCQLWAALTACTTPLEDPLPLIEETDIELQVLCIRPVI